MSETLEQIAERLAFGIADAAVDSFLHHEIERDGWSRSDECYRAKVVEASAPILDALREVEARSRANCICPACFKPVTSGLCVECFDEDDDVKPFRVRAEAAEQRAEKAESNLIALRIAEAEAMSLVLSHEGHIAKLEAKLVENDALQADYQRIISAVLDCDPIPASNRPDDDRLEPPWDVIRRVLAERDAAIKELADIIENDEGQRERANTLEVEVERLREALSGPLESPASFEDSRLDYAERQVDTIAWDEAKAALERVK